MLVLFLSWGNLKKHICLVNPDTAYSIFRAEFVHFLYNAYVIAYINDLPLQ